MPIDETEVNASGMASEPPKLFNRVVQIDGEDDYDFWYVLTYLPDLQWCHVAPLEKRGTFTAKPSPTGHVSERYTKFSPRCKMFYPLQSHRISLRLLMVETAGC